jgi:hypothetical protein
MGRHRILGRVHHNHAALRFVAILRRAHALHVNRGGKLSEVASPPTMMNSLSVHAPAWGYIASFVYFVVVYIRQSASIAPGHRAMACAGSVSCGLSLCLEDGAICLVVSQSMRSPNTANWPSGYPCTRTFAFTKCGRNREGGSCRLSVCHLTVLSLPTVRSS